MVNISICIFLLLAAVLTACQKSVENSPMPEATVAPSPAEAVATPAPVPTSLIPNLQSELLDDRNKITAFAIGTFDFKNHTYPLPHGWENPDGREIKLTNGKLEPVETEGKEGRRIGMSYVTTKYFDVTGDGEDEALVVLKIETGGGAIPQIVYVFTWKSGAPELIWPFRTGDRADGGLKDIRAENGMFVVELYGKDRFLLNQMETGKVGDDLEQLCCPTYFTRTAYKWSGGSFTMQGKRLTFSMADPKAGPVENMADKANAPKGTK